jgi:hypothetical protein
MGRMRRGVKSRFENLFSRASGGESDLKSAGRGLPYINNLYSSIGVGFWSFLIPVL